ncbi:hypothetical protein OSTOST_07404, partial [Ostertagia ostertagi]
MKTDHANDVSFYDDFEMHGLLHVLLAVSALLMRRPEGGRQRVDHRPAKSSQALSGAAKRPTPYGTCREEAWSEIFCMVAEQPTLAMECGVLTCKSHQESKEKSKSVEQALRMAQENGYEAT